MATSPTTVKDIFQTAVDELKARNPRLSLRAIAKRLATAPSYVSEVLSGKKTLSVEMAARIADKLRFDQELANLFISLAELESTKDDALRSRLSARVTSLQKRASVRKISSTAFSPISDWFYFAILEMTQLSGVKLKADVVAARLGLTVETAQTALDKLIENGLLEKGPQKTLQKSDQRLNVSSETRNDDLRKFHKQLLAKASEAVDTQTNKEKFIGSETFAFDSSQLPTANQILEDCFSRLVLLASQSPNKDSIYHVSIQMFRLTKGTAT